MLEDVLDIYTRHDAAKTLSEWLSAETRRATTSGRYFSSVGKCHYNSEAPLTPNAFKAIDDKFVVLSGNLCRKSALSTNPALLEAAGHSDCDWVLCGFPPVAMTDNNSDYDGSVVNVRFDEGFDAVFSGRVPFDPEIAWFPKCVVAGFFYSRKVTTENFPTIRPSLIQYQRPISPTPNARDLSKFVEGKLEHPIYLKGFPSRVYLYYLLPAMYRSWGVGYDKVDSALRAATLQLARQDWDFLDPTLKQLYSARFGLDAL